MSNIERALRRAQQEAAVPTSGVTTAPPPPRAPESAVAGVWHLHPNIVAYHHRYSAGAEAFRKLAAQLLSLQRQHELPCLTVGVTSAVHSEGKSLTAANLAVVLAQDFNVSTLLVDCDLRRPTFRRYLGLDLGTGLADLVSGASLEETIVGTPLPHLHLLGSGARENPTAVFEGGRVGEAVAAIRTCASVVVCDCPPTLPVADTQLLAPHLDGMLMVVRAGQSQGTDIRRMTETLHDAALLGFVLNYADMESPTYYHADDYYYREHADRPTA